MNQISYRITFTGQEVFKFILASCISIFSTRINKGRSDSQSILQWVLGKVEHTRKKSRVFQLHENCLNVCTEKYLLVCLITVNSTVKLIINHITILSLVASNQCWSVGIRYEVEIWDRSNINFSFSCHILTSMTSQITSRVQTYLTHLFSFTMN